MDAVFLSYSRRQVEAAREIHRLLSEAGGEVFLDEAGVEGGSDWVARIGTKLRSAGKLVILASPEALASEWARTELSTYLAQNADFLRLGRVVMARMGGELPTPVWLAAAQWVDLRERDGLGRLFAAIGRKAPAGARVDIARDELEGLRAELYTEIGKLLPKARDRNALAAKLGLGENALEHWGSPELTANVALVRATGESGVIPGARRLLEAARATFFDEPEVVAKIDALRHRLPEPRPGEDRLLIAWKEAMEADHRELVDVFRKGAKVAVDEVFVEPAFTGTEEGEFEGRRTALRALLSTEAPWATRRWVVKGDPGSGKTTILRHLAWSLAAEKTPRWVPIYVSLPSLARGESDILKRAARRLRQRGGPEGLEVALEGLGQAGRLLVLLDGLDEVPADQRADAIGDLRALAGRWPKSTLVVSSRPLGFVSPGSDWRELKLLPFDRERQVEFLGRWFGDEARGEATLSGLGRDVAELASNPLYLTLVALLVEHGAQPSQHRAVLYDQVFELLLRGLHRVGVGENPLDKAVYRPDVVAAALREIALGMTAANQDAASQADIESFLSEGTRREVEREYRRRDGLDGLWRDLTHLMGVLGPYGDDPGMWRWWHRSFREAWAARALHRQVLGAGGAKENVRESLCGADAGGLAGKPAEPTPERAAWEKAGLAMVSEATRELAGKEGQWAEPYSLLSGRLVDPDALLVGLSGVNAPLAQRALSSARRVSSEVVARLLDLDGDDEARRRVYLEVPAKVGDTDRAADLLLRLGSETTDPDDLFFLDLALARLAKGAADGDAQARFEGLRPRLLDHLREPMGFGLEETIETSVGPRRLWALIPAGSGRIGGTGHGDEEPAFELTAARPFRLLAVPVTNQMWARFQPQHRPPWPDVPAAELPDHPVVHTSWYAAVTFVRWLGRAHRGARLPTEYEWEYACRAGTRSEWWCPEAELDHVAWTNRNAGGRTHPVALLRANPWGLFDIHGNVWEWTASPWTDDHQAAPRAVDPGAPPDPSDPDTDRVIRGGSSGVVPARARSAFRSWDHPGGSGRIRGLRVLVPIP